MTLSDPTDVMAVWCNGTIPVIAVPPRGTLRVRLPYSRANRDWLRLSQSKPQWNRDRRWWEVPRAWLQRLSYKAVSHFGRCYIIQSYCKAERCAPACLEANGVDCDCSCLGKNHGCGNEGRWFEVHEAFACRWAGREYAIRLLGERVALRPTEADLVAASGIEVKTYFVKAGKVIKIGRSSDVASRIRSLQTANPHPLEIVGTIDGDYEAVAHRYFSDRNIGGEWYALTEDDVLDFVEFGGLEDSWSSSWRE